MNTIILKSFISRLDFISKRIEYQNNNLLEIKITNLENNSEKYLHSEFYELLTKCSSKDQKLAYEILQVISKENRIN